MSKRNKPGLVVIERGGGAGGLLWLLVGGVIGAGLGLLLAPHSGKKTRELLGERLATLKESAKEVFDELGDEAEELPLAEEEEEEDTASAEEEPVREAPTARAELERRLARARARRHRELAEEDEEPVA